MSQADIFEGLSGKDEQQQALTEQTEAGKKAGQAAVKLQQESNPLTEEQQEIKTQLAGAELLPENRRGIDSIFAGLSDNDFEWWQARIANFASQ